MFGSKAGCKRSRLASEELQREDDASDLPPPDAAPPKPERRRLAPLPFVPAGAGGEACKPGGERKRRTTADPLARSSVYHSAGRRRRGERERERKKGYPPTLSPCLAHLGRTPPQRKNCSGKRLGPARRSSRLVTPPSRLAPPASVCFVLLMKKALLHLPPSLCLGARARSSGVAQAGDFGGALSPRSWPRCAVEPVLRHHPATRLSRRALASALSLAHALSLSLSPAHTGAGGCRVGFLLLPALAPLLGLERRRVAEGWAGGGGEGGALEGAAAAPPLSHVKSRPGPSRPASTFAAFLPAEPWPVRSRPARRPSSFSASPPGLALLREGRPLRLPLPAGAPRSLLRRALAAPACPRRGSLLRRTLPAAGS